MAAGAQTYLVECYSPGIKQTDVQSATRRAAEVADQLTREGRAVEYAGAILVPEDEVVFHLFSSHSEKFVREASVRAAVPFERISVAVRVEHSAGRNNHA